jgi:predicted kinase
VAPLPPKPVIAVISGAAGCGKTSLARRIVRVLNQRGLSCCMVDKDTVADPLSSEILRLLGVSDLDRDSDLFRARVRHLEYQAALAVAKENAALGLSVVLPGPWSNEIEQGWFFKPQAQKIFPNHDTWVFCMQAEAHVLKPRIVRRANPRDAYKLVHWDTFEKRIDKANRLAEIPGVISLASRLPMTKMIELVLSKLLKKRSPT